MCSAYDSREPVNHSAPGISRRASTCPYGVCAWTSKKSQIAAQKASRSDTDHSQSAVVAVEAHAALVGQPAHETSHGGALLEPLRGLPEQRRYLGRGHRADPNGPGLRAVAVQEALQHVVSAAHNWIAVSEQKGVGVAVQQRLE